MQLTKDTTIRFKICQPTSFPEYCGNNTGDSFMIFKNKNSADCIKIAGKNSTQKKTNFFGK